MSDWPPVLALLPAWGWVLFVATGVLVTAMFDGVGGTNG